MTCREAARLVGAFFDGELDGRLMREAALHVTRCEHCEREVQSLERVQGLLRTTVGAGVAGLAVDSIWEGVRSGIAGDAGGGAEAGSLRGESRPGGTRADRGWRRGGRRAGGGRRLGQRVGALGRISAVAGLGVASAGLAAFLLLPGEEGTGLRRNASLGQARPAVVAGAAVAGRPASSRPATAPVELVGAPSGQAEDERLASEWNPQILPGEADFAGPAMSLWPQPDRR